MKSNVGFSVSRSESRHDCRVDGTPKLLAIFATCVIAWLLAFPAVTTAQTVKGTRIEPFLKQHCFACHSGDNAEASLDIQAMSVDVSDPDVRGRWVNLYDRVANGEMPPKSEVKPDGTAKSSFLKAVGDTLTRHDLADREVILRRLTAREYENTVCDLFGIEIDVSRVLIDDSTKSGFDNTGADLSVSGEQMKLYIKAADLVLDKTLGPRSKKQQFHRLLQYKDFGEKRADRVTQEGGIMFGRRPQPIWKTQMPLSGRYRVRVRAKAVQTDEPIVMRVSAISQNLTFRNVGFVEVPPGKVTTIDMEDNVIEQDRYQLSMDDGFPFWTLPNPGQYKGPGLLIESIEVEGPIDEWPPASRKRLLGDVDPSTGNLEDVRQLLSKVLPRAFRREIDDGELALYLTLAEQAVGEGCEFEKALRRAMKAILCSPEFLFLDVTGAASARTAAGNAHPIDDYTLASRLSYFLWSSMPDQELFDLARRNELKHPEVLRRQVERMLNNPKSRRFTRDFTGQWLRLQDIDFTMPDFNLYPEYNELLRKSMLDESHAFFHEILGRNLSVQNFLDSDFVTINQPLANFYGIAGVKGWKIRRVELPNDSVRGGVLTQASVLKVSADGTRTSPVLRGAWILKHLFGTPPSPPPASVSAIEPDIRGAKTIREQLERHRADPSCHRCHRKIDPPGFALESFDVIGGQREWCRTLGGRWIRRQVHPHAPANVLYKQGPEVDATGTMADGRTFAGIREFKQILLEDEAAMARSLARLLLSYSLGRKVGFSDRPEVERIVAAVKKQDHGLRSIIHEVVQSESFRSP